MGRILLLFGMLTITLFHDACAEGDPVGCNVEGNKTVCEIKVRVSFKNGVCLPPQVPGAVIAHRNATDKVVMIWSLDDGTGDAPRFRFNPDKKGIDITTPYAGYLEDQGSEESQGRHRYKWKNLNPLGSSNKTFDYVVNVQHRRAGQWSDCPEADPVIINRD